MSKYKQKLLIIPPSIKPFHTIAHSCTCVCHVMSDLQSHSYRKTSVGAGAASEIVPTATLSHKTCTPSVSLSLGSPSFCLRRISPRDLQFGGVTGELIEPDYLHLCQYMPLSTPCAHTFRVIIIYYCLVVDTFSLFQLFTLRQLDALTPTTVQCSTQSSLSAGKLGRLTCVLKRITRATPSPSAETASWTFAVERST